MYMKKRIAVVVPAYNEQSHIASVLRGIPEFIDGIYAVNDASADKTLEIMLAEAQRDSRVTVINRESRGGVGAAILTGHARALREGIDVMVVVAGDGQMDPAFLPSMIAPVVEGRADYVKGNRLSNGEARKEMPPLRLVGNFLLTSLTKVASGYWRISDPQNGYTAISADILRRLDIDGIELGFAFENDMLVKLRVAGARVMDVAHPAIYRGQRSKIRWSSFVLRTSWVLLKDYLWRIWAMYFAGARSTVERRDAQSGYYRED